MADHSHCSPKLPVLFCWLFIASAFSLLLTSSALAVELPGLNWVRLDGAAECLSSAELAAAVNARVGESVFGAPDQARLLIEGYVRRAADGWAVTLDVVDPSGGRIGQRQLAFSGESCHVIDEAVTLVVAVTLYPNTQLLPTGGGPEPEALVRFDALFADEPSELDAAQLPTTQVAASTAAPPAAATDRVENATADLPRRKHVDPVALSLGAVVGSGQLPGLNIAAALHGWLQIDPVWPIEAAVSLFANTTLPIASPMITRAPRVHYSAWSTALRVCPLLLPFMPQLYVCTGGGLGVVRSAPRELGAQSPAAQDLTANVNAALLWRRSLARSLHLRAAVIVAAPLIRRAYTYRDELGRDQQLFRAPAVTGQLELGVGVNFN